MRDAFHLFKTGSYRFHPDPNFNFQLNRMATHGDVDLEELREAAKRIKDMRTWVSTFLELGERAENEGRLETAATYLRGAEFFMYDDIVEKHRVYEKAVALFRQSNARVFDEGWVAEYKVPYGKGYLPVWSSGDGDRGIILLHGGFDSWKEEFLRHALYLAWKGCRVFLFEGPGQGEVLKRCRIPFTWRWEEPVKAVLDHYGLEDVTIVGLSLGGMLAPRAAAFEARISKVVAWGVMPDFLDVILSTRPKLFRNPTKVALALRLKPLVDLGARLQMAGDSLAEWGIRHGCYAFGADSPYRFLKMAGRFQWMDVAGRITQDFLLLGSTGDHFVPRHFYRKEIDMLTKAKSVTFREFTQGESAEAHCNVGNVRLVLDFILAWLDHIRER